MINIDITKLPKKINEIAYFKKSENGTTIYNYSSKNKNDMVIIKLEECEIEKDFAINGSTLEMVRKLQPLTSLELENDKLVIKSKKGTFKGALISETMFSPNTDLEKGIKVNLKALKVLSAFTSNNDKKPILAGINIKADGTMAATDSFKLARYLSVETVKTNDNITIPKTFIDLIKTEIDEEEITLKYNDKIVALEKDNITFISSLIAGNYPDVSRIFRPSEFKIVYETETLKEAINLAKNVGINNNGEKYLSLLFDNGKLVAQGTSTYETIINDKEDNKYKFVLSAESLELVLNNITNENVEIGYISNNQPIQIEDNGIEYIVLPIKTN